MGGVVGPILASAVSNAGGLGMLSPWRADIDTVRRQIRETRTLTSRPFGVNLNPEFPQEERLAACLDEGVPVASFFWRDPSALVTRAKAGGATACAFMTFISCFAARLKLRASARGDASQRITPPDQDGRQRLQHKSDCAHSDIIRSPRDCVVARSAQAYPDPPTQSAQTNLTIQARRQ